MRERSDQASTRVLGPDFLLPVWDASRNGVVRRLVMAKKCSGPEASRGGPVVDTPHSPHHAGAGESAMFSLFSKEISAFVFVPPSRRVLSRRGPCHARLRLDAYAGPPAGASRRDFPGGRGVSDFQALQDHSRRQKIAAPPPVLPRDRSVFLRMGSLVLLAVYGNLTLVTPVVSVSRPQFSFSRWSPPWEPHAGHPRGVR